MPRVTASKSAYFFTNASPAKALNDPTRYHFSLVVLFSEG